MPFPENEQLTAVILGATGGIGRELGHVLRRSAAIANLVELSRSTNPSIDYTRPATLADAAEQVRRQYGEINILLITTGILTSTNGAPPEKSFSQLTENALTSQFLINATGPALSLQAFLPLMPRTGYCRIGILSARVGSIGDNRLGGWIAYRAAKAALNQIIHTAAIELKRTNDQSVCVALHPGTIETELSEPYARGRYTHSQEDCAQNLLNVLGGLSPEQSGGFFDYDAKEIVW